MQSYLNAQPRDVYRRLASWNMDAVKTFLVRSEGLPRSIVDALETEYKHYVALAVTYGAPLPISAEIDPFWHVHIIHTENYIGMCRMLGVEYLHHAPVSRNGAALAADIYRRVTLPLYRAHFGEPNPAYWGGAEDERRFVSQPLELRADMSSAA